jgi:hypothetical protein
LEIADEHAEIRALSRGELEAQILGADRVQASAPRDTGSLLRLTAQAEADAWQQAADAEAGHDQVRAENARSLAATLAAETSRLEAANARYEEWSARTASIREMAGKAKAELQCRQQQTPAARAPEPQSMATWWRDFQAHGDAVDRAIEREHQAAISIGEPWPPGRRPETGHEEPGAATSKLEPQPGQFSPAILEASTEPEIEAARPVCADDECAARLNELQARADEAARRIDVQRAELDGRSKHTARIEREAQAGSEAGRQADTSCEMG